MTRKCVVFFLLLFLAAFCLSGAGCGKEQEQGEESGGDVTEEQVERPADPARTVTMNGRSVMGGWV